MTAADARTELLLKMYDQMFNDINRHILVVWQAIGVVIGAFALFSLVQKQDLPLDIAVALLILLCGWMIAQLYDSGYWYNRNLVIIANIEREILNADDLSKIHFYFGEHRRTNKLILHLRIQRFLAISVAILVVVYHLHARVRPGLHLPLSDLDLQRTFPYVALAAAFLFINYTRNDRADAYAAFLKKSPGKDMNIPTSNIPGHGMLRTLKEHLWLSLRLYRSEKPAEEGANGKD
jgi:hypothetical protein